MDAICTVQVSRSALLLLALVFLVMYVVPAIIYANKEDRIRYMMQFGDLVKKGERLAKLAQLASYMFLANGLLLVLTVLRPLYCGA